MADKQVETGVQRDTGKQLDNEVDCAPVCQVVWETLRPGWEVLSSETGRRRQKKQNPSLSQDTISRLTSPKHCCPVISVTQDTGSYFFFLVRQLNTDFCSFQTKNCKKPHIFTSLSSVWSIHIKLLFPRCPIRLCQFPNHGMPFFLRKKGGEQGFSVAARPI